MKSKRIPFILMATALVLTASTVFGAVVEGVRFEEQLKAGRMVLDMRGAGVLRYMVFIKAYAGALYLPEDIAPGEALADVPKHLEVEYFHAIKGEDFGPATIKSIQKNIDPDTLKRLMPRIAYHNGLYVDVAPGDRYALTYIPGNGTTLRLNGTPLGTIEGADFAAALFSIWLGPNPVDDKFKQALLGMSP